MKLTKVKYVKHPVSPEAKRELNKQGYKVLDARFDPNPIKDEDIPKQKSRGRSKSDSE